VRAANAHQASTLHDVRDPRIWAATAALVLLVWLGGAAVTKFSLEQMAYFAPIGVVAVAATVGIVLLWVKVVLDSLRRHRNEG
jgi:membrane protein YdbS with pleckstrin-like domain